ncbi:MAG: penicillin acylase family protein [Deltaproteobacteria bacterium]|nr:MAG: penicillin acylase family protein [Deltaproteobacteria bacterium]
MRRIVFAVLAFALLLWVAVKGVVAVQGIGTDARLDLPTATVTFDGHAVPTIEGADWGAVVEAQGYVAAGMRFFQMDLQRRAARGRLAELVPAALPLDERRHREDWEGAANAMADMLPPDERTLCDRYAQGVNRFLDEHRYRWGIEYLLLGVEPEPWSCRDTLAIALAMAEQLSSDSFLERDRIVWHEHLPPDWYAFLFPQDHPDNVPLFGTPRPPPPLPRALPPVEDAQVAPTAEAPELPGSNSWAVSLPDGTRLLANDPHLGANVPHLWLFVRLYLGPERWVVGVSIPGVPGVVLGMNPAMAWGFTNVGEDVDDLVEETLSEDGTHYVDHYAEDGTPVWRPVEVRRHEIRVKGGDPVVVESRHTRRGPLVEVRGRTYSRMWLPLRRDPSLAGLWTVHLADARTLEEADRALDRFRTPAQNVTIVDTAGNVLYRTTGTGVIRRASGKIPGPGPEREWLGLAPPIERPRRCMPAGHRNVLVTANQRIWVDDYGHDWASDRRAARIREALDGLETPTQADMENLQLDTKSAYHLRVARFVVRHAPAADAEAERARGILAAWSGHAFANERAYALARSAERAIFDLLLGRVKAAFLPPEVRDVGYPGRMRDAWIRRVLEDPEAVGRFGLSHADLAAHALAAATAGPQGYIVENRWQAQHPFVGRVPVVGAWFRVAEYAQWGDASLVRVERPRFGASFRVVWNLADPAASRWITPVGQSGHLGAHFSDLQERFHRNLRLPVFDGARTYRTFVPETGCGGRLDGHVDGR